MLILSQYTNVHFYMLIHGSVWHAKLFPWMESSDWDIDWFSLIIRVFAVNVKLERIFFWIPLESWYFEQTMSSCFFIVVVSHFLLSGVFSVHSVGDVSDVQQQKNDFIDVVYVVFCPDKYCAQMLMRFVLVWDISEEIRIWCCFFFGIVPRLLERQCMLQ